MAVAPRSGTTSSIHRLSPSQQPVPGALRAEMDAQGTALTIQRFAADPHPMNALSQLTAAKLVAGSQVAPHPSDH